MWLYVSRGVNTVLNWAFSECRLRPHSRFKPLPSTHGQRCWSSGPMVKLSFQFCAWAVLKPGVKTNTQINSALGYFEGKNKSLYGFALGRD